MPVVDFYSFLFITLKAVNIVSVYLQMKQNFVSKSIQFNSCNIIRRKTFRDTILDYMYLYMEKFPNSPIYGLATIKMNI